MKCLIFAEKQCIISQAECKESEISQEEADAFMDTDAKKDERAPPQPDQSADDLLADL
jgi:hypothetical protein